MSTYWAEYLQNMFLCMQTLSTDLISAAYSGSIDLIDLLVQRFDLPPDQWMKVSISLVVV